MECHGTATPLGDPIEIAALTKAFRKSTDAQGYCAIGSVKGNIGHLDAAAGVAGLIKTALMLRNRELAPSLNFERPTRASRSKAGHSSSIPVAPLGRTALKRVARVSAPWVSAARTPT